ncbi:hypothetical protein L9F63_026558, partial [Diploptera punctata]
CMLNIYNNIKSEFPFILGSEETTKKKHCLSVQTQKTFQSKIHMWSYKVLFAIIIYRNC